MRGACAVMVLVLGGCGSSHEPGFDPDAGPPPRDVGTRPPDAGPRTSDAGADAGRLADAGALDAEPPDAGSDGALGAGGLPLPGVAFIVDVESGTASPVGRWRFMLFVHDLDPPTHTATVASAPAFVTNPWLDILPDGTRVGSFSMAEITPPSSCVFVMHRQLHSLALRFYDRDGDGTADELLGTGRMDVDWANVDLGMSSRFDVTLRGVVDREPAQIVAAGDPPWIIPGGSDWWLFTESVTGPFGLERGPVLFDVADPSREFDLGGDPALRPAPLPFGVELDARWDPRATDQGGNPVVSGGRWRTIPDPGLLEDGTFETEPVRAWLDGDARIVGGAGSRSLFVDAANLRRGGRAVMRLRVRPGTFFLRASVRLTAPSPDMPLFRPIRFVLLPSGGTIDVRPERPSGEWTATGDPAMPYVSPPIWVRRGVFSKETSEVIVIVDQTSGTDPCGPRPAGYSAGLLIDELVAE